MTDGAKPWWQVLVEALTQKHVWLTAVVVALLIAGWSSGAMVELVKEIGSAFRDCPSP